jgi:hypothetical protein
VGRDGERMNDIKRSLNKEVRGSASVWTPRLQLLLLGTNENGLSFILEVGFESEWLRPSAACLAFAQLIVQPPNRKREIINDTEHEKEHKIGS